MLGILKEDVRDQHADQHDDDQPRLFADGAEGRLQLDACRLCARGGAHAGGNRAAADIPLTQTLMHKHQCAGCQHIRNLADEDEEHGQLVHDQRHGDGDQHARKQRQTIPEIHTHEHIGGAACQRTGGHVEAVRRHGDRGGDGEHGGDGHGTQDVDHVIERHEAAALDEGKGNETHHQRDNGCPIQQETRRGFDLLRGVW